MAAWLILSAATPEARRIPHEPKAFHRLVWQLLIHACNAGGVIVGCFEWLQNKQSEYWVQDNP